MTDEWEKFCKEAGGTEKNEEKLRIASVPAQIRINHIQIKSIN
jgi:hypothetical protein